MKNIKLSLFALAFIISMPQAGSATTICDFKVSTGILSAVSNNYFGFDVTDSGKVIDKRRFYSTYRAVDASASDGACLETMATLESYEASGSCKVIWPGIAQKIQNEFGQTAASLRGCMNKIEAKLNEKTNAVSSSNEGQIVELRQRLIMKLGERAVALMTDQAVIAAASYTSGR